MATAASDLQGWLVLGGDKELIGVYRVI